MLQMALGHEEEVTDGGGGRGTEARCRAPPRLQAAHLRSLTLAQIKSDLVSTLPAPRLRDRRPSAPVGPGLSAGVGAASTRSAWVSLEITLKTYNVENTSIHFRLIAPVIPEYECYHHVTNLRRLNNFSESVGLDGHGGREPGLLTTAILCLLFPASGMGSVPCLPHRLPFLLVVPDFGGSGRGLGVTSSEPDLSMTRAGRRGCFPGQPAGPSSGLARPWPQLQWHPAFTARSLGDG